MYLLPAVNSPLGQHRAHSKGPDKGWGSVARIDPSFEGSKELCVRAITCEAFCILPRLTGYWIYQSWGIFCWVFECRF